MNIQNSIHDSPTPRGVSLELPPESQRLVHVRTIIADIARRVGFAEEEVAKIEMAVDEACANVVRHAYLPDKTWLWQHRDPEIRLRVRTETDRLVIEVTDHGQNFDFAAYCTGKIQNRLRDMKTSGYGIPIIQLFMDEVRYTSDKQTGNTLRLIKYFQKPVSQGAAPSSRAP